MKFPRKIFLIFLYSFCLVINFFGSIEGAAMRTLTLEDSINLALSNNKSILIAKEKTSSAQERIREAKSALYPQLSLQGSYTHLEPIMGIPIAPGESISLGYEDTYLTRGSLQQSLYTSGRISIASKQAKLYLSSAEEEELSVRDQVIYEVKRTFYSLLLAQEYLNVSKEAVDLAERHLKTTQVRYVAGTVSKYDVLRADVQLANVKTRLVRAKNGLALAQASFKNILGLDLKENIEVKGEFRYQPLTIDLERCIQEAFLNRAELKQLRIQERMAELGIKLAKTGNKPILSLVAGYQYKSDQASRLFHLDHDSWDTTLLLTIPIFDGFATKARINQAKSDLNQVQLKREQLEANIKLEVEQAFLQVTEAEESILAMAKNVEQARESLRIAQVSYQYGVMTSVDVLDNQLALTQAETDRIQAVHDFLLSKAKLEKAMGSYVLKERRFR